LTSEDALFSRFDGSVPPSRIGKPLRSITVQVCRQVDKVSSVMMTRRMLYLRRDIVELLKKKGLSDSKWLSFSALLFHQLRRGQ
jgi:hypothetical protein